MEYTSLDSMKEKYLAELDYAHTAISEGNLGKARVCSRRAVGVVVSHFTMEYGTDAMNIINNIAKNESSVLPNSIQQSALDLSRGFRRELAGENMDSSPINSAKVIIDYFLTKYIVEAQ